MSRLALAATSIIAVGALAACGGASASSTSSASPSPGVRAVRAAAGQLVQIEGTTLVLSGAAGDTTVDYTPSTTFTQARTATVASIATGECIVATGTRQTSGAIAVDSVRLSRPTGGSCATGGFRFGGGAPRTPRPGLSLPPQFASRAAVRGTVSAVAGTSVTVQPPSGAAVTITVPTTVPVTIAQAVQASALDTGECLVAAGARSASGTVTAQSITIVPAGPSGCFSGRGGFGGGFGGFGGFGGGGGGSTSVAQ